MKVYKDGILRDIPEGKLTEYQAAGWTSSQYVAMEAEEVIKLKPPVKSKGTAKQSLDNAINKGEE